MKISFDNDTTDAGIGTLMTVGDVAVDDEPILTLQSNDDTLSPLACGLKNGVVSGLALYGLFTLLNYAKYAKYAGMAAGAFEIIWALRKETT